MTPPSRPSELRVGSACPLSWDELSGGDAKRFCSQCQKHVHNLSVISPREQQKLTEKVNQGQRVCVAYQTNHDGSIRRQDRPERSWQRGLALARTVLALFVPWAISTGCAGTPTPTSPTPATSETGEQAGTRGTGMIVGMIVGKIAVPRATPTPTPVATRGEAVAVPAQARDTELGDAVAVATPTPTPVPTPGPTMGIVLAPTPTPTPSPKPSK